MWMLILIVLRLVCIWRYHRLVLNLNFISWWSGIILMTILLWIKIVKFKELAIVCRTSRYLIKWPLKNQWLTIATLTSKLKWWKLILLRGELYLATKLNWMGLRGRWPLLLLRLLRKWILINCLRRMFMSARCWLKRKGMLNLFTIVWNSCKSEN